MLTRWPRCPSVILVEVLFQGYKGIYHASDKIVGILLDSSRSHDSVKITVLGVEIRIGRLIEFEAGGEQSKMADDELVAMDLSWGFSFSTDF